MGGTRAIMFCLTPSATYSSAAAKKNWKRSIDLVRTDCRDMDRMIDELYLAEYEGGFF